LPPRVSRVKRGHVDNRQGSPPKADPTERGRSCLPAACGRDGVFLRLDIAI